MAGFNIEQDISGASAFESAMTSEASVNAQSVLTISKGLFGLADDIGRTQLAVAKAAAPTQSQQEDASFGSFFKEATRVAASDPNPSTRNTKLNELYNSFIIAGNGELSERQQSVLTGATGYDFGQPARQVDIVSEAFAANPLALGFIEQAKTMAKEQGLSLNDTEAYEYGKQIWAKTAADTQAFAAGRTIEWNAQTRMNGLSALNSFRDAAFSALKVEQQGGNVNPDTLLSLEGALTKLKGNFARPTGVSETDYQEFTDAFKNIEDALTLASTYDREALKRKGFATLSAILGDAPSPLYALVLENPELQNSVYFDSKGDMTKLFEKFKETGIKYNEVEFDPIVLEYMGVTSSAEGGKRTPVLPVDALHPQDVVNKVNALVEGGDTRAIANFLETSDVMLKAPSKKGMETQEGRDSFSAGVANASIMMNSMDIFAGTKTIESIFSQATFQNISLMGKTDPDRARMAQAQMVAALEHQTTLFTVPATAKLQRTPFTVDPKTGKIGINTQDTKGFDIDLLRKYEAVAIRYYSGSFEAMLKDGLNVGKRVSDQETSLFQQGDWGQLLQEYGRVQGIPQTLQRLNALRTKANMDYAAIEVFSAQAVDIVRSAGNVELPSNGTGTITQTTIPTTTVDSTAAGTLRDPARFTGSPDQGQAWFDSLPAGTHFIDPSDNRVYRK